VEEVGAVWRGTATTTEYYLTKQVSAPIQRRWVDDAVVLTVFDRNEQYSSFAVNSTADREDKKEKGNEAYRIVSEHG